ncbi:MAG: glycoside hydrolase family 26 protein [Acidimicrobiia bacterium]
MGGAWRRIHDIFERAGATNVTWVWSPYVESGSTHPIDGLYPGDDVVDLLGVDGYNWGTYRKHSWKHPDEVFGSTLARLRKLAKKPIVIAETESAEQGGDKAKWIREFFRTVEKNPDVIAFVWFNLRAHTDWRITSSPSARQAVAAEMSDT